MELRTSGSELRKKKQYRNSGPVLADYQILTVADQREAEALVLNSGPAEADYGKNSRCPPLNLTIVTNTLMKRMKRKRGDDNKQGRTLW